jgi:hypothetical protein
VQFPIHQAPPLRRFQPLLHFAITQFLRRHTVLRALPVF